MTQDITVLLTHTLQSFRGVVERAFASLKQWSYLQGKQLKNVCKMEVAVDNAMALCNAMALSKKKNWLNELPVPRKAHVWFGQRLFGENETGRLPPFSPSRRNKVDALYRRFSKISKLKWKTLGTVATRRATRQRMSGGIAQIQFGPLQTGHLIKGAVWASFMQIKYHSFLFVSGGAVVATQCSCVGGYDNRVSLIYSKNLTIT